MRGEFSIFALVLAAAVALSASAARADLIDLSTCNTSPLSQPFAPWADPDSYELAPGGAFETQRWMLNGGAQRVPESETYAATGTLGSWSLALPAGSSAQSPLTCVDAAYPSVRFFIAGTGLVAVSMVVGNTEIPAGVAVAAGGWMPSPVMVTSSAIVAALSGGVAHVSLRIRALTGHPLLDDVYIDPWCRR